METAHKVETIYGTCVIQEPIIQDLILSRAVQRLKGIHQGGIVTFVTGSNEYTRYDHCLGVYALLNRFKRPLEEQVAGLLHDASHTVFSHIGDLVFNHTATSHSYQDEIHDWYLQQSGLGEILDSYGVSIQAVSPKRKDFYALETDLPRACADRIDYNLQYALHYNLLTKNELNSLVGDLRFANKNWYFVEATSAKRLATISLYLTEHLWGAPWSLLINMWMAEAILRGLEINLVSKDELHFSTDIPIWNRLTGSDDPEIKSSMHHILHYKNLYALGQLGDEDLLLKGKFRGIDPLVEIGSVLCPLSECDDDFREKYLGLMEKMRRGWPVKLANGGPLVKDRFLGI